jgi:hypothetical protein
VGIDADQLGGLAERIEKRSDLRTPKGARAVVVLAADDGTAQGALGGVVVERHPRIIDEARQGASDKIQSSSQGAFANAASTSPARSANKAFTRSICNSYDCLIPFSKCMC